MTNEELKKKIVEILEEGQTPVEYDDGDWGQTYFPTNEDVADALIDAVGKDSKCHDVCEEFAEETKKLMQRIFGDYIANEMSGFIDEIKEKMERKYGD